MKRILIFCVTVCVLAFLARAINEPPCTLPSITSQPLSQTNCQGSTVSFAVTTSTNSGRVLRVFLNYQWYFNATNLLAGATNTSLTLTNIQATNAGNYSVIITNTCSSATSSNATLTVNSPPSITTSQPENQAACSGQTVNFTVNASGNSLSYQWRKNGANLVDSGNMLGATLPTLTLTSITTNDSGYYDVVVSNACGSVIAPNSTDPDYSTAKLTVVTKPVITLQPPVSQTICLGQTASFSVTASGAPGTAPLSYQWRKNGVYLYDGDNISGAATATLLLSNVTIDDAGSYDVKIGSPWVMIWGHGGMPTICHPCDDVFSSASTLIINSAPLITVSPTNQTVMVGGNATFSVIATGTAPLSYQWYFNTTNLLAGATNYSLTLTNVQLTNAGNYSVVVANGCGSVTSTPPATLTVLVPPSITTQPQSQTNCRGSTVNFTVTATGTTPLSYHWYFNATNLLAGATNYSLTLTNVQLTNAGNYSVVVANSYGSVTSSIATLTVQICSFCVNYDSNPQKLAEWLMMGNGVTVTNAKFAGATNAIGIFGNGSTVGLPAGAPGLPVDNGIILCSGDVTLAVGPNNASDAGISNGVPGDVDLSNIFGGRTNYDATALEFDIVSTNSFVLQFQYIFASEEYPEWISDYNDLMAIFVSTNHVGTNWIITTNDNIALVPGTNLPVSVSSINGGGVDELTGDYIPPTNPQYYVDNRDPNHSTNEPPNYWSYNTPVFNIQYDGTTVLLTNAQAQILAGITNHIKIAIADYGDSIYDSAVFIKAAVPKCD